MTLRATIATLLAAVLALASSRDAAAQAPEATPGVLAAWSQISIADSLLVRAVTAAAECPRLAVDGVAQPMGVRARPSPAFPITVCEALVPRSSTAVAVDDAAVPTTRRFPERIVVIGDTGCRLRAEDGQACNDAEQWPFARIAARAAALRPDLVIHTGNFFGRASPCPRDNAGCADSPNGDTWDSWRADVFAPAAPLLAAAPWLVVRGWSEACGRAADGWFRLLDPHPRSRGCLRFTEPYVASFGPWQIAAIDAAEARERDAPAELVAEYSRQIAGLGAANFVTAWMVSHWPFWAAAADGDIGGGASSLRSVNATLQASARSLPDGIGVVLSGHYQAIQALSFSDRRPATIVAGNGGSAFVHPAGPVAVGDVVDGLPVRAALSIERRHGFTLIERDGEAWKIAFLDFDGAVLGRCRLQRRTLDCAT